MESRHYQKNRGVSKSSVSKVIKTFTTVLRDLFRCGWCKCSCFMEQQQLSQTLIDGCSLSSGTNTSYMEILVKDSGWRTDESQAAWCRQSLWSSSSDSRPGRATEVSYLGSHAISWRRGRAPKAKAQVHTGGVHRPMCSSRFGGPSPCQ